MGIPPGVRMAVLLHGGHKNELPVREDFLPPGWICVSCNGGRPLHPELPLPPNFINAPADVYTPDLVAACDCVIGKIGYGCVHCWSARPRACTFCGVNQQQQHSKKETARSLQIQHYSKRAVI